MKNAADGAARTKKVLIVRNAYRYDFGGGERVPVNLADVLSRNGYKPTIVSRSPKLLEYAASKDLQTVHGWWWARQNWSGPRVLLSPAYFIWQILLTAWYLGLLTRLRPDVVHPQSKDDFIAATIAAKLLGKRVIWSDHADLKYVYLNDKVWYKNPIGKLVKLCSRGAYAIILTSQNDKRQVEETLGVKTDDKYKVIYNGIFDRPELLNKKHDGNKVIFAATSRLVTAKGIGELIEAFEQIDQDFPAELWLFGEGPEEKKFVAQAAGHSGIKFKGFPEDTLEQVAKADIFVHPSYLEGFSISLIEAAMLGKPIIACNVGGNPELVKDGINGILIPACNSGALASAMKKLATDKTLKEKYGKAARKTYEGNFVFENIIKEQYLPLYE
ncbi:MAG: glycosyl transferase group 1 [Candidatus Saccharibacteria bacterium]|nr:glycosyl transferase group 1 [Candidatus Saccharibacteria bacterium]